MELHMQSVLNAAALLLGGIGVGLIALARHLTHDDDGLVIDWEEETDDPAQLCR